MRSRTGIVRELEESAGRRCVATTAGGVPGGRRGAFQLRFSEDFLRFVFASPGSVEKALPGTLRATRARAFPFARPFVSGRNAGIDSGIT